MLQPAHTAPSFQRALLIALYHDPAALDIANDLLNELAELVRTLGIPIAEKIAVRHRETHPKYLLGTGKAQEIAAIANQLHCDVLIFDNELTPAQQRNWETLSKKNVLDRHEVILNIFSLHARTREARLQSELARLQYALPRLKRAWTHLGQQAGGIGSKGEGETQLEQDRRKIRAHIDRLRRELAEVRKARATQRKDRLRTPAPTAAIVGYTNAGKSSLLRRLTGANVLVEDKLFATLDTTTRKVALPGNQLLLLTDTVGFVRKLPHQLIESFHATLEEAVFADFLVHVLDASHPRAIEFFQTTESVLASLGASGKPTILVLNKIDLLPDPDALLHLRKQFPDAVPISLLTGQGIGLLIQRLDSLVSHNLKNWRLKIPPERSDLVALLHREGVIHEIAYEHNHTLLSASVPRRLIPLTSPFKIENTTLPTSPSHTDPFPASPTPLPHTSAPQENF